jgi:hypothetical protein
MLCRTGCAGSSVIAGMAGPRPNMPVCQSRIASAGFIEAGSRHETRKMAKKR